MRKIKNWVIMQLAAYLAWLVTDDIEIVNEVRKEVRDFYNREKKTSEMTFTQITHDNLEDYFGSLMQVIAIEKAGIFKHPWRSVHLVVKVNGFVYMIDANGERVFRELMISRLSALIAEVGLEYDFYLIDPAGR
jgi:hypothetical protein